MIRDIYHAIAKRSATQQSYSGANFMKTMLIGIAATAALSLFGVSAHANCAYLRAGDQQQDIQLPAYRHHFADLRASWEPGL